MTSEYPDFVFVAYDGDMTEQTYDIAVSCEAGTLVGKPIKYIRHDLHTRAMPDVPELVRYDLACDFDGNYAAHIVEVELGDYVRYDQAAAMLAAKDEEIERLKDENRSIFDTYLDRHNKIVTLENELAQIKEQVPVGYLTYEDLVWLSDGSFSINKVMPRESACFNTPLYTAPVDQTAEIEMLRKALKLIASETAGLDLHDTREISRAALSGKEPK